LKQEIRTKPIVALISFPWASKAPYKLVSQAANILRRISKELVIIDGNIERLDIEESDNIKIVDLRISVHQLSEIHPLLISLMKWFIELLIAEIRICKQIKLNGNEIDTAIFYLIYPYYFFPLITCKINNIKVIEILTRSPSNRPLAKILTLQNSILFWLLDGVSPESTHLLQFYHFNRKKKLPLGHRYIDTDEYRLIVPFNKRGNTIGFIGRLIKEKGIIEFIESIPYIEEAIEQCHKFIGCRAAEKHFAGICNALFRRRTSQRKTSEGRLHVRHEQ